MSVSLLLNTSSRAVVLNLMLIEDSPLIRQSLRDMLSDIADLQIASEYDHAAEAIAAIDREPPDVVLLDIKLRASNSMQVLRHVKQTHPQIRIIVFSSHSDESDRNRFLAAGAYLFLSKTDDSEKVHQTLTALAKTSSAGRDEYG